MSLVRNMGELEIQSDDSRNVINMVSNKVREFINKVYEVNPDYLTKNELELEEICKPSKNCNLIRMYFWREYNRAQDKGCRMMMSRIHDPVMSQAGFYEFLEKPEQVAWMMCKPADEFMEMELANYEQRKEFHKIATMPLFESDGKTLKIKEAKLALELYKLYADRLHGAVLQRVEKKVQHIPSPNDIGGSKEDIEKKIKDLEAIQIDVKTAKE